MTKKIRNTGIRRLYSLVLCFVAVFCITALWTGAAWAAAGILAIPDAGSESRVIDAAELLPEEDREYFENTIREYRDRMKFDIVVVTTADAKGKTSRDYADDFYDEGGYGYGRLKNGLLFLIDMENRELYISTGGDAIRLFTDDRIDSMLDGVYEEASDDDFSGAVEVFLQYVDYYYEKGIVSGQYNYNIETGQISRYKSIRWYELLIAVVVSAFAAGSTCLGIKRGYEMRRERKRAGNYLMAYRADCKFAFRNHTDDLVNKFVTTAVIPRNQNHSSGGGISSGGSSSGRSSTHTSSSGRSHGGGGRKF